MATEIVMPKLGWTMEEGVLAEWIKKDGEPVHVGEILFTVESDKALQEVEAFDEGILRIPPDSPPIGSTVKVGGVLAFIVQPGERAPFEQAGPSQSKAPMGVSPAPLQASRAVAAPASSESSPEVVSAPSVPMSPAAGVRPSEARTPMHEPSISPRARRIAGELGIDWTTLTGSGRTGRIVERDVQAAAARSSPVMPLAVGASTVKRTPVSSMRRRIAENMANAAHTAAPVTLTTEADATELVRMRQQLKSDQSANRQPIPTFTDLFARLAAHALGEHPLLNSRLEGDEIVTEPSVNIGLAVDTERGLVVPVVRDVQTKTLRQVATESQQLIERTRSGKLTSNEMRGSTFTITNLGMYEIDAFTPIINLPESAILGLGRIVRKQVVIDEHDRVAVRQMMVLSLTFDHRLVDGAPAARFLQRIKQLVEQPYLWLVT